MLIGWFIGSCQKNDAQQRTKVKVEAKEIEPTPTISVVKSEKELIIQEIINVFGEDSDKAFLLLMGKDNGSCAENRMLNPRAVNDNSSWGGTGKDRGIFQINDQFHPISDECAFDYKCNINYAHRMYLNDNKTFIRWTCGKFYKI
ncbi:MAG: hypothetical protein NT162_03405 [Candidatus Woesebacteria bacterium]|nr:hypothetical protein [Candidatus Woesebacteria bacterium]